MPFFAYPFRLLAVLACISLVTASPGVDAQSPGVNAQPDPEPERFEVDTTRWLCQNCPYPLGWYGSLSFGPGWVSEAEPKFGDYRGLDDDGWFADIGGDAHYRNPEGIWFDLTARDLGLDSRQFEMRGGERGRYTLRLGWQEIPKYRGFGTETPFLGVGSDTLTLPAGWRPGLQTQALPDLAAALSDTRLDLKRKILDAGLTLKFASRWSWEVDYRHEEKDGTRPFGAGVFMINTTHFPAPVDFTTDRFDMGLAVTGKQAHLRFGFSGSEFRNGHASVTWQNPFTPIGGTETLQAALEPDNEFYQFNVAAAFAPSHRFRFSGRAAWSRAEQDDPFLPGYSINPQFSDLPLPRLSYTGKIDSTSLNASGSLVAQLSDRLDLIARFKIDERDNRSPVEFWTPVITDLVPHGPRPNRPYSFERDQYRVELSHRTLAALRLAAGWQREDIERSLQSVEETSEDNFWGEASLDPLSWMALRLRLEAADRDASPYLQLDDGGPIEHPLQRKFHLADRERNRAVVEIDLVPAERMSLSLAWYESEDEYEQSAIGLTESRDSNATLDLGYAFSDTVNVHGFVTREDVESTILSAAGAAEPPWQGRTHDRFLTFGAGAEFEASERFSVGFDYVHSNAEGRIRVATGAGEPAFPDLETRLGNARLSLSYRVSENWSGALHAEYEHYDSDDWYVDGLEADGIPAVLSMGADSPDYDVVVLRLFATCRF